MIQGVCTIWQKVHFFSFSIHKNVAPDCIKRFLKVEPEECNAFNILNIGIHLNLAEKSRFCSSVHKNVVNGRIKRLLEVK